MKKLIILLNGPKHSGKDTIGNAITQIVDGVELFKFAEPLRVFIKTTLGITDSQLELMKDQHVPLFGMTIRQAMIAYSEDFCKPKFGANYFGRLTAAKIRTSNARIAIVTDSGFASEAQVLRDEFGEENLLLIRLFREGCNFDGDSRSHFTLPFVAHRHLYNDGTVGEAANRVLDLAKIAGAEYFL